MEESLVQFAGTLELAIGLAAVLVVAFGAVEAFVRLVPITLRPATSHGARKAVWRRFGIWLLLGLEFALAADIIASVISPSWQDIGELAAIAAIRTFLNYFLEKDLESTEGAEPASRPSARVGAAIALAIAMGYAHSAPPISAQSARLTFVSTAWTPFTNASGQPRFALDLVEAALARFDVTATTAIVKPAEFTAAMTTGPFDGSAAAWKDADREQHLIYSEPYLENRLVLVGRRGADVSASALNDLAGRTVAIVEGYSYGDVVDLAAPMFVRSRSEEDSLTQLLSGTVDYTLMDELVVQHLVANYPEQSRTRLQIGSTPLIRRELHLAVRRTRPDAASIVSRFNAQLRGMIADRTYHRLLHVDWIHADITGDGIAEYVPGTDHLGRSAPQRVYALHSPMGSGLQAPSAAPGFYVGGTLYSDWASVPESYKDNDQRFPDSRRSEASIFKFVW